MELIPEYEKNLLAQLKSVQRCSEPYGICSQLGFKTTEFYEYTSERLEELFRNWPMFSGCTVFPVPHPDMTAEAAYLDPYIDNWDGQTVYGQNRRNLLTFMIAEVEKSL